MVYANVGNPTTNYDGSKRKGINLFTNSIVGLDMHTGKLKWYYQTIHHDIWDWDLVSGPTLFDATINGKTVKIVASPPKTCFVYALNRETGEPIHPTQPIPFNARNVAQSAFSATYPPGIEDPKLIPLARPIFTPPSVKAPILISPGATGGPNRGAGSFSPRTGFLYVTGKNDAMLLQAKSVTEPIKPGLGAPGHYESFTEWKMGMVKATQSIAAFDPATGDLAWVTEVPGTTSGGNIVTAGDLVFEAVDRTFYALDAKTGQRLAEVPMKISASPSASPDAGFRRSSLDSTRRPARRHKVSRCGQGVSFSGGLPGGDFPPNRRIALNCRNNPGQATTTIGHRYCFYSGQWTG